MEATRDTIYKEIMENGWSEEQQSFVQSYGSDAIDASALLISLTGFTAEADPRIVRTIERIQRELMLTSTATARTQQTMVWQEWKGRFPSVASG